MATSPLETSDVTARFSALESSHLKVIRLDEFMERKIAEKQSRQEESANG